METLAILWRQKEEDSEDAILVAKKQWVFGDFYSHLSHSSPALAYRLPSKKHPGAF